MLSGTFPAEVFVHGSDSRFGVAFLGKTRTSVDKRLSYPMPPLEVHLHLTCTKERADHILGTNQLIEQAFGLAR